MVDINCGNCGKAKKVRQADLNRGWGKFCSKRCKAVAQAKRIGVPEHVQEERARDADPAYDMLVFEQDGEWDMDDSTYWNEKEY
jgi:endogenous inhibitor of DNA gyrase (YacG/DUF329 family)